MKLFILEKLLQDDSREMGMRYVYIYMLTLDVVKSCHIVAGNELLYLELSLSAQTNEINIICLHGI